MKPHLLFPLAFGLGVLSSLPVGAAHVEIAKRALIRRLQAAFSVLGGVLTANALYGLAAFFGLAPFLTRPGVLAWFNLACGLALLLLAWRTLQPPPADSAWRLLFRKVRRSPLKSKRVSYLTGFLLGVTNPVQIVAWLFAAALAKSLNLIDAFTPGASGAFVACGVLGMALYPSGLIFFLARMHRFISKRALGRVYKVMGVLLATLGALFLFKAGQMFLRV